MVKNGHKRANSCSSTPSTVPVKGSVEFVYKLIHCAGEKGRKQGKCCVKSKYERDTNRYKKPILTLRLHQKLSEQVKFSKDVLFY
ncbi:hypothetical protein NC651_004631 [Populus alba x Populus x berolinensis]|nr:hypothetical protein NC651_004631 [Populus alba x Populus x berolinensis]